MKNYRISYKTGFLIISMMFFVACQKNPQVNIQASIPLQNIVNQWMESKMKDANVTQKKQLTSLSDNLLVGKAETNVTSDGKRKILVVPLSDGFISSSNKGLPVTNSLLLVLDKNGNVEMDFIGQFLPINSTAKQQPPAKLYTKLFGGNTATSFKMLDGTYRLVGTNNDRPLVEYTYKNGWGVSFGYRKTKLANSTSQKSTGGVITNDYALDPTCTDWYWVTTNPDGSEDREYLYRTCKDGGRGGGSGDGGKGDTKISNVSKQFPWKVVENTSKLWSVISTDQLSGVKNPREKGGGHFTGNKNLGYYAVGYGVSCICYITSSFDDVNASTSVSGIVSFDIAGPIHFDPQYNKWTFSKVDWSE